MTHQGRAKTIFLEAIEQHERESWPAFLDEQCNDDASLRQQVEQLLAAHSELGTYEDSPENPKTESLESTRDLQSGADRIGASIGRYKLQQQIGEGGFGVVYMAEQLRPVRRQVALKIIKPGMDTKEVIARFEAERQALALMDHPHIAKVLDAGETPDRRPYFVMELVKGVPVTEFCDKHNFSTRQRLELFSTICTAIQHAHQKGVIHRDIKPSNVMVTLHDGQPVVKVIDFGVSKAISQRLTEKTLFTRYGQMVGTPQYMSPKQAEMSGLDVDTRSDIYSLGVLLYELLTGTTPLEAKLLRSAGYAEMVRLIQEEEPLKPSTRLSTLNERLSVVCKQRSTDGKRLRQLVQGDLDWIVMKSLEKDRSRRYETANAFSADIQRHLQDEPVAAGPPSAIYRVRKFVRRNKGPALAGSLIVSALIVGLTGSVIGFVKAIQESEQAQIAKSKADESTAKAKQQQAQAQTERNFAQEQQRRAESVLGLMKQMLSSAGLTAENPRDYTVREMLDDFAGTLDMEFESSPEIGAEIWATVGEAYHSIEEIDRSVNARRKALALAKSAYKDRPEDLARLLFYTGYALLDLGEPEFWAINAPEAEDYLRQAVAIYERLPEHDNDSLRSFAEARIMLGWSHQVQYRFDLAKNQHDKAVEIQLRINPPERMAVLTLGSHAYWQGDFTQALAYTEQAMPTLRNALEYGESGEALRIRHIHLIWGYAIQAYAFWSLGRFDEARAAIEQSLMFAEPGREHALETYVNQACLQAWIGLAQGQREFARTRLNELQSLSQKANKPNVEMRVLRNLAAMNLSFGNTIFAEKQLTDALAICERRHGLETVFGVACRLWLSQHYEYVQDSDRSGQLIPNLVGEIEHIVAQSNQNPEWLAKLAWAKSYSTASSDAELVSSIELCQKYLDTGGLYERPTVRLAMARAQSRLERFGEAIQTLQQGQSERWVTPGWFVPIYEGFTMERELIRLLMEHGSPTQVEEAFRQAIDDREEYFTSTHPATLEAKTRFASWLIEQDRLADASRIVQYMASLAGHQEASNSFRTNAIRTLVKLFRAADRPKEVAQWESELKAIAEKQPVTAE